MRAWRKLFASALLLLGCVALQGCLTMQLVSLDVRSKHHVDSVEAIQVEAGTIYADLVYECGNRYPDLPVGQKFKLKQNETVVRILRRTRRRGRRRGEPSYHALLATKSADGHVEDLRRRRLFTPRHKHRTAPATAVQVVLIAFCVPLEPLLWWISLNMAARGKGVFEPPRKSRAGWKVTEPPRGFERARPPPVRPRTRRPRQRAP